MILNKNPYISFDCEEERNYLVFPFFHSLMEIDPSFVQKYQQLDDRYESDCLKNILGFREFNFYRNNLIFFNEQEKKIIERGLIEIPKATIGKKVSVNQLHKISKHAFVFLGVPIDLEKNDFLCTKSGCRVVREQLSNINKFLEDTNVITPDLYDLGNINTNNISQEYGEQLHFVSKIIFKHKLTPIFIGGDHSLTHFTLKALSSVVDEYGVIIFDAHSDFQSVGFSESRLTHANVMNTIIGENNCKSIVQFGAREIDSLVTPPNLLDKKIKYVNSIELAQGDYLPSSLFDSNLPYYISIDIDVLDPSIAPEVSYPVPGGPQLTSILKILQTIKTKLNILGIDIVEVSSSPLRRNMASMSAAKIIENLVI